MRGETKHDQISVGSVDAVPCVCIVALLGPLRANEVEDFVLALSRHKGVRKHHSKAGPLWISVAPLEDVRLQRH